MYRGKTRPAIFLDRDGTLIEERGYPSHPDQVRLLPGVAESVERLRRAGFVCVVITNQSGVGRGLLTESQMHAVNKEMIRQLKEAGTDIDGLYFCTFAPLGNDKTVIEYHDRKPGPGMLLRAAREMNLDLTASWIIGDSVSDILAGRNAGCVGQILLRSGHDTSEATNFLGKDILLMDDLGEAAEFILSNRDPNVLGS